MVNFQTPGVYIQKIPVPPKGPLGISIAGFVGQAMRGPTNFPQAVNSWEQFSEIFGGFVGFSYLPASVFGFFLNGGEKCYVVRVAHETAQNAAANFYDKTDTPAIGVVAINPGEWGNDLEVSLEEAASIDLVFTELNEELTFGQKKAKIKSVAGLAEGDQVTMIHKQTSNREQFTIEKVNSTNNKLDFVETVSLDSGFPAGSKVLGKGFKLIVRYRPKGTQIRQEVFDNLTVDKNHERYFVDVINGDPEETDYVKKKLNDTSTLIRVKDLCSNGAGVCSRPRSESKILENGEDGPRDFGYRYYTGYDNGIYFHPCPEAASEETKKEIKERLFGLATFETISEIGLIAIPDLILPDIYAAVSNGEIPKEGILFSKTPDNKIKFNNLRQGQHAMLRHCEKMADRFAILDAPRSAQIAKGDMPVDKWSQNFQFLPYARYGALYYPWIVPEPSEFSENDLLAPPSGYLSGLYSKTERQHGVGKPPANELLQGIIKLEFTLSDTEQNLLNPNAVNCLRVFPGRGVRVWGARTLSTSLRWRYISASRVTISVVKTVLSDLKWTVFEPNDRRLRDKITSKLTLVFNKLFQSGALVGTTAEGAFFIKCDDENNPKEVVDRGEVISDIGFAPVNPGEFILLTVKRSDDTLSIARQTR